LLTSLASSPLEAQEEASQKEAAPALSRTGDEEIIFFSSAVETSETFDSVLERFFLASFIKL
jgi:hypothetical protein